MHISERTVRDTELDKVLEIVRKYSVSPEGCASVSPERITDDRELIDSRAAKIEEYIGRLGLSGVEPFPYISDLFDYADRTHADFPGTDVYKAGQFIHSYIGMLIFLDKEADIYDEDRELGEDILSSLDSDGNVFEDHPRLLPLIRQRDAVRAERERFSASFIAGNRGVVQQSEHVDEQVLEYARQSGKPFLPYAADNFADECNNFYDLLGGNDSDEQEE